MTAHQLASGSGAPSFSVVIATRNSRLYLPELCSALSNQDEPIGGYEVIFVEDASHDGSYEYLQQLCAVDRRFQVLRGKGLGPAAARNIGIVQARGRFIAFTDADTLPHQAWLTTAYDMLSNSKTRVLEGAVLPWTAESPPVTSRRVRNEDGGRYMTANMVYERSLLLQVGGFDETFKRPHFLEDSDLAFRVMELGQTIPFVPEVAVRHRDVPRTPLGALVEGGKLHWMPLLARKHPSRYRMQLRPKVQGLRPGDVDFLLALPLVIASQRSRRYLKWLTYLTMAVAARRVLSVADVRRAREHRLAWLGVSLLGPAVRAGSLLAGWIRFKKLAL